ncbi:hypothetical protein C0993_000514 [Termitomyces sp. T159_Od127]|nr:hypothetical protein C0993_000514 [Termitomyces sp. T159_Od127]
MVDRSGSMATASPQSRIDMAKNALILLLRMLPASGTTFNVYIFDDQIESLSPRGLKYNKENLRKAVSFQFKCKYRTNFQSKYVDGIFPRGGTGLSKAVRHTLQVRDLRMPTAIFLLTDGEIDPYRDDAIQAVRDAVAQAPKSAPIRVFTLGIGDRISTETCEELATAGNGVCLYAPKAESIMGKCACLFRAARTPILRDVTIDWGVPGECLETRSFTSSGQMLSPENILVPSPVIQQVPTQVNNVHSGTRSIVSAIIEQQDISIPQTVYLHGTLDIGGSPCQPVSIPVETIHLEGADTGMPMIHTLTALRLIKEHEGKLGHLPATMISGSGDDIRKAMIISLGERYQLVSQYTSFIAIGSGQDDRRHLHRRAKLRDNPRQHSLDTMSRHDWGRNSYSFLHTTCNLLLEFLGIKRNPPLIDYRTVPDPCSTFSSPDIEETEDNDDAKSDTSDGSYTTFSTLSSINCCDFSGLTVPSHPDLRMQQSLEEEEEIECQLSPKIRFQNLDLDQAPQRAQVAKPIIGVSPIFKLVRLQDFDGSYPLKYLRCIPGIGSAVDEVNNIHVDAKAWATALAIAFMQKEMVDQRAFQNHLVIKSWIFLDGIAGIDSKGLLRHASQVLARLESK